MDKQEEPPLTNIKNKQQQNPSSSSDMMDFENSEDMDQMLQHECMKSLIGSKTEVSALVTRKHDDRKDDKDNTSVVPSVNISRGEKRRWSYKPSPHMFPSDAGNYIPSYLSNTVYGNCPLSTGQPRKIYCVSIYKPPRTIEWNKRNRPPPSGSNDYSYLGSPSLALSRRYHHASSNSLRDDRIVPSRDISAQILKTNKQRLLSFDAQYNNDSYSEAVPWDINNITSLIEDLHKFCSLKCQYEVHDDECRSSSAEEFAKREGSSNVYDRELEASHSGWPVTHDNNAVVPTQKRSPYPLQNQLFFYVNRTVLIKFPDTKNSRVPHYAVYDFKQPIDLSKIRSRNELNKIRRSKITELVNKTKAQIQLQNLEDVKML